MRLEETDEMSLTTLTTMTTMNLLLIKRIILRSRKQGSPHAHLMNSIPSQRIKNSQDRQESGTCPLIL